MKRSLILVGITTLIITGFSIFTYNQLINQVILNNSTTTSTTEPTSSTTTTESTYSTTGPQIYSGLEWAFEVGDIFTYSGYYSYFIGEEDDSTTYGYTWNGSVTLRIQELHSLVDVTTLADSYWDLPAMVGVLNITTVQTMNNYSINYNETRIPFYIVSWSFLPIGNWLFIHSLFEDEVTTPCGGYWGCDYYFGYESGDYFIVGHNSEEHHGWDYWHTKVNKTTGVPESAARHGYDRGGDGSFLDYTVDSN